MELIFLTAAVDTGVTTVVVLFVLLALLLLLSPGEKRPFKTSLMVLMGVSVVEEEAVVLLVSC